MFLLILILNPNSVNISILFSYANTSILIQYTDIAYKYYYEDGTY